MRITYLLILFSMGSCTEHTQNTNALRTITQSISLLNTEFRSEIIDKQIIIDSLLRLQKADPAIAVKRDHFERTWKDLSALTHKISAGILKQTGFNPPDNISGPEKNHPGLVEKEMQDNGRLLFQKLVDFESQLYLLDSVFYRENKERLPLNLPLGKHEKADENNFGSLLFADTSPMTAIAVLRSLENKMLCLVNKYFGNEIGKKYLLNGHRVQ